MSEAAQTLLSIFGVISVAIIVNPYLLLPLSILSICVFFFRKIYLNTARQIKQLESTTRSPIFTHLGATLNGLTTIRSCNKQEILQNEFDHILDIHSGCYFTVLATSGTFGLYIDMLSTIFMTCLVTYYMLFDIEAEAVKIGLAISQVMKLTGLLPWGKKVLVEFQNKMR